MKYDRDGEEYKMELKNILLTILWKEWSTLLAVIALVSIYEIPSEDANF